MKNNNDPHLNLTEPQKKALAALSRCVCTELKKYGEGAANDFVNSTLKDCYYEVREDVESDLGSIELVSWFRDLYKTNL